MTTLTAALVLLGLLGAVVALLQHNHHRAGLPHAPYGADDAGDPDLLRVLHDLAVGRR